MDSLSVYRDLADCYDRLGQVSMRDRFLILAADAALAGGQPAEAERLRQRLLQGSRHHMLRPYNSFAEAVGAADVQTYLRDLRVNYPLEVAQQLLESLQDASPSTGPPVSETQPVNWGKPAPAEPAPPIPPTAPLLDMTSPARPAPGDLAGGVARQEERALPVGRRSPRLDAPGLREEPPAPASRPLAQPLPSRPSPPRSATAAPSPPARPSPAVPVARALPATARLGTPLAPMARRIESLAPEPPVPAAARPAQRETPPNGGVWLNMLLVGVVFTAGLALAVFTLARPFLPPAWLP